MSVSERRILFTRWLGDAWESFTTSPEGQKQITDAFKSCGMYNDMDGKENHLVTLDQFKDYQHPAKSDPLEKVQRKRKKAKSSSNNEPSKKQKKKIQKEK